LRKYCLILERRGYNFLRGESGRRAFLDRDVIAIRKFQELSRNSNITLEEAAAAVISMVKENDVTSITLADMKKTIPEEHIQAVLKANEALQGELQSLKKQMASTHQKLDVISRQVDIVITETRAERHRKDKKWWRFWG
jgi:hypothetical protein